MHAEDPATVQAMRDRTGIGLGTSDFAALLATGIDFVVLAGPLGARLAQVRAAAEQAVHCLVYAPMAADLETATAMAAACDKAQVKLGVAVPGQDDPVLDQVRCMIAADWLGGLVCVQGILGDDELLRRPPAPDNSPCLDATGHHPFLALMSQHIHLASWLCGRSAVAVTAQTTRGFLSQAHDGGVATAVLRGNVLCTFTVSRLTRVRAIAIHGTDGGVRIAGDRVWLCGRKEYSGDVFDYVVPDREQSFTREDLTAALDALTPTFELHGRFARWIDDCDDFPCPAEQSLLDLRVADAMARAAESGRAETV